MNRRLFFAACFFCLALTLFSLSAAHLHAQTGAPPATPPDAANGLAIFGERCANCHGDSGAGDGPLAENLDAPPAALSQPDYYNAAIPSQMYDQVTNGDMAAGMPGFGPNSNSNPLSEAQRWDAVAAVFSLGFDAEARAAAEAIYTTNCADCHGEAGDADAAADLSDAGYWFDQSNDMVVTAAAASSAHADLDLAESDLLSTVRYARTFAFPAADEAVAAGPTLLNSVVISGSLSNGTLPDEIPGGVPATLLAFANFQVAETYTTTVSAAGHYTFTLSDVNPDWVFLASVEYKDVAYTSNVGQVSILVPNLALPITVFEPTQDAGSVSIEQLHVVVGFAEGRVEVAELYVFTNASDRVYVGASGDPEAGTVTFNLPAGAQNISFERGMGNAGNFLPAGDDVIQTAVGYADTLPLRPGASSLSLLVRYTLPYEDGLTVAHPVDFDVNSASLVMNEVGVSLENDGSWQNQGAQAFGEVTMVTYARAAFSADTALNFTLSGEPDLSTGAVSGPLTNNNNQIILGVIGLIIAGGVAFFAVRRWQAGAEFDAEDEQEALLQEIAELDDDYAAGNIAAGPYQRQREELMADLLDIWDDEHA